MEEDCVKTLLGKKIRRLRNNLSLTQFQLGEMANINQRQVALIESGKSFPSLRTLVCFAHIFSCNICDLFSFQNINDPQFIKKEIINIIESCSDDKLKILYTIAREII